MKRRLLPCLFWCWLLDFAVGRTVVVYVAENQTLTLRPEFKAPLRSMEWKRNRDLLVEWDGTTASVYDDRMALDASKGALELSRALLSDSGTYTLTLNDVSQEDDFAVNVIRYVPRPEVRPIPLACAKHLDNCTLLCHGDTGGAMPISYFWRTEPGAEMAGESNRSISRTSAAVKRFYCVMQNPVGRKESRAFDNPFYEDRPGPVLGPGGIMAVTFAVLIPALALLAYFAYRFKRRSIAGISENHGIHLAAAQPLRDPAPSQ